MREYTYIVMHPFPSKKATSGYLWCIRGKGKCSRIRLFTYIFMYFFMLYVSLCVCVCRWETFLESNPTQKRLPLLDVYVFRSLRVSRICAHVPSSSTQVARPTQPEFSTSPVPWLNKAHVVAVRNAEAANRVTITP